MTSAELRRAFIGFFEERGHSFVPSSPVVPRDDPTLLFANAGMNQFKDLFLGKGTRPYRRAVNSQKCIRVSGKHNDLEEVGHDTYHHTFFEMLGNWSFGDYFKAEAIEWAWEFLTRVCGLDPNRIFATVYRDDAEAAALWPRITPLPPERVRPFGEKENFWEMAETGPCGPCSEIHYDRGPEMGCGKPSCAPNCGCGRFIELWNLVFIQFNREADRSLNPLPARHVDTGMGLERLSAVMRKTTSNYDTDLFTPILRRIEEITGRRYEGEACVPMRVIADHGRALTAAIADGGYPSNEGRGYVLRRLLRRAARYGRKLMEGETFLYRVIPAVVDVMGEAFPEMKAKLPSVVETVRSEEDRFNKVIDRGIRLFNEVADRVASAGADAIPGQEAYELYDTYGFPIDLVEVMARERRMRVDIEGFNRAMEGQKDRSRRVSRFDAETEEDLALFPETKFLGYETLDAEGAVIGTTAQGGILLDQTPFYAESGGQVGDRGTLSGPGFEFEVEDVRRKDNRFVHLGRLRSGSLPAPGARVRAGVDPAHRAPTVRNHTATHLLHNALRGILGNHVEQRGSLVAPDRLRFDFSHFKAVAPEELKEIEDEVNRRILENHAVSTAVKPKGEALKEGVMALFGEKYGDVVRVVAVGDFSKELCGGTHVRRTGDIGLFRFVAETSVAAGIRRVEAVTGSGVLDLVRDQDQRLAGIARALGVPAPDALRRCEEIEKEIKALRKEVQRLKTEGFKASATDLGSQVKKFGPISCLAACVPGATADDLRRALDTLRKKHQPGAFLLASTHDSEVILVCGVTDDLAGKGVKAGDLLKKVAGKVDGSGGGKPHLAQGGGKNPAGLPEAFREFERLVAEATGNEGPQTADR